MRSNGLTASAYSPVADVNPTVAEGLLHELRRMSVAAYCEPVARGTSAGLGRPEYTVEVLVRLYVDAAATEEVVELLASRDPHLVEPSEDLTWAQIVAGYDAPQATTVAPWPAYEDLGPDGRSDGDSDDEPDDGPTADAWTYRYNASPARDYEEERFVPPEPPPLPRLSGADKVSWLGLIGGPLVLLVAALFSLALPTWVSLLAALGFIGGFVSLVIRMDNGQSRLDDPDNGAQV